MMVISKKDKKIIVTSKTYKKDDGHLQERGDGAGRRLGALVGRAPPHLGDQELGASLKMTMLTSLADFEEEICVA